MFEFSPLTCESEGLHISISLHVVENRSVKSKTKRSLLKENNSQESKRKQMVKMILTEGIYYLYMYIRILINNQTNNYM